MKRKFPSGTIEHFFSAPKERKPIQMDEISLNITNQLKPVKASTILKQAHMKIPSLSDAEPPSETNLNEELDKILENLKKLFDGDPKQVNFARTHSMVEHFIRYRPAKELYSQMVPILEEIIISFLQQIPESFHIAELANHINSLYTCLENFRRVFLYFERDYIFAYRIDGHTTLPQLVYSIIRNQISDELVNIIVNSLIESISKFRCGDIIEEESVIVPIKFIKDIDVYTDSFEPTFVAASKEYLESVGGSLGLSAFTEWLGSVYEKESELNNFGLTKSTTSAITVLIGEVCLKDNAANIFTDDFKIAIDEHNPVITTLLKFYAGTEHLSVFIEHFAEHYRMKAIVAAETQKVPKALQVIIDFDSALESLFDGNIEKEEEMKALNTLKQRTKSAIENGFSNSNDIITRRLAKYLSKGNPVTDAEIELLDALQAHSLFETAYVRCLKDRILHREPIDERRERIIINAIYRAMGGEGTDRLEDIMKDLRIFGAIPQPSVSGIDFSVAVLHRPTWFTVDSCCPRYPEAIQEANREFERIFDSFGGRPRREDLGLEKLYFDANLTTVEMEGAGGRIELNGLQAVVLLALQHGSMSLTKVAEEAGVPEANAEAALECLMNSKPPLVTFSDSQFSIVYDLNLEGLVVKVPQIGKVNDEAKKAATESDRALFKSNSLKSKIVVAMKEARKLDIRQLRDRVSRLVSFVFEDREFLKAIEEVKKINMIDEVAPQQYEYR